MDNHTLIERLAALADLSREFRQELEHMLVTETYRAHQILHAAGQKELRLWFVAAGFVRAYYFDHTGKEHTQAFFKEQDLIFSYQGYWQENSNRYLEVLEQTLLFSLRYTDLSSLLQHYTEAVLLKDFFVRQHEHQEQFRKRLMALPAGERYLQTRKLQPDLFRRASVRLIAAYLNMTRENLSRLMARDL